eukprot:TRINITY_DN5621_c0_g1_i2.p1 TRINITY_DN5621_c0_g1~~TRINITY_DN5621_c0_g1_i2.p1  ORF type:complete len:221 (-),score=54.28 TRINITY_DN5621_c0_g1_i2:34-636(-)
MCIRDSIKNIVFFVTEKTTLFLSLCSLIIYVALFLLVRHSLYFYNLTYRYYPRSKGFADFSLFIYDYGWFLLHFAYAIEFIYVSKQTLQQMKNKIRSDYFLVRFTFGFVLLHAIFGLQKFMDFENISISHWSLSFPVDVVELLTFAGYFLLLSTIHNVGKHHGLDIVPVQDQMQENFRLLLCGDEPVSYTHLTLPTIYSV